jgi:hypothetical protein
LGKFHCETTRSKIAAELLPKQNFDIRFVINHENEKTQVGPLIYCEFAEHLSPDFVGEASRGTIRYSAVKAANSIAREISGDEIATPSAMI